MEATAVDDVNIVSETAATPFVLKIKSLFGSMMPFLSEKLVDLFGLCTVDVAISPANLQQQRCSHSHTAHTSTAKPLSSSCAFQGLKRGFGGVQAVGQCVFLTHRFQELTEHVQPLQNPPRERERTAASCFPVSAHVAHATRPQPSCWAAQ